MRRDFVSCYSDHAVKVSDSSCSGSSASVGSVIPHLSRSHGGSGSPAAARTAVTCAYRVRLSSTGREFVVSIIWSKPLIGHGFCISVDGGSSGAGSSGGGSSRKEGYAEEEDEEYGGRTCASSVPGSPPDPLTVTKKKGARCFKSSDGAAVGLHWDLSSARYAAYGPEPVESFHLAVVIESELSVLLGDNPRRPEQQKPPWSSVAAECALLSRSEHVSVPTAAFSGAPPYTTKARFREGAREHEVSIKWGERVPAGSKGGGAGAPDLGELAVFVDKKKVVHVRRLRWNFRGNQTIFVDGAPVDVMWDVYGWWFGSGGGGGGAGGGAVFLFRARTALESRLWLEEDASGELFGGEGSSLVIHANKCV